MLAPGEKKTHRAYSTTPFANLKVEVYDFSSGRTGEHALHPMAICPSTTWKPSPLAVLAGGRVHQPQTASPSDILHISFSMNEALEWRFRWVQLAIAFTFNCTFSG